MSSTQAMNTSSATQVSSATNSGSLDSLWGQNGGVYTKTVLAIAFSMDSIQNVTGYYTNQVMNLSKESQRLIEQMADQSTEEVSSTSDFEKQAQQASMYGTFSNQLSNGVSQYGTLITQGSQSLTAQKNLGNAFIAMFDKTSRTR